ncbi:Gfo/Idh/MocA family oxidoreductase [Arthrobacter sp. B2a2-09]|uniref:Gfo/Idh/MocA family oxidoreductase n=1 Tax=Arthrobacter sp. B2a2-09 TaxID=2952822 RepID=UPI0022CD6997|nr:Gfo/Idh/MocA family oxidoreductase [Arthrobacter sp. B2a2-09]MCZ9881778.1 Gfo/Idh/MocA family oxidoreductase [Arthrobacter sp. B2a2-09]
MKLGLVGFGVGGHSFHAPYIEAADGVELSGIVTRSRDRRALAVAEHPEIPLFESMADLIDHGVDAVVITTPPETRRELVLEAIAAGVHVIADKPFAPNAEVGLELVAAAEDAGVMLNVFHNRRWDTDIRTLRSVIDSSALGEINRFESRFDQDQPESLTAGPAGGLLRDLGSHLVDQALWLFGPAATVYASLDWVNLPEGRTDSGFFVTIAHQSGVRSHLSSNKTSHLDARELRVLGSGGSYVSEQTDVQTRDIFAGRRPVDDLASWGYENEDRWGTLATASGSVRVPSEQGAYHHYYEQFALAVAGRGPQPVPALEGVRTLQVLDAARLSDAEGRSVPIREF